MDQNVNFSISDLLQVKNIIEVASSRGAFRAEELSTVGSTYDKLKQFLSAVVEQAETTAQSSEQGDSK